MRRIKIIVSSILIFLILVPYFNMVYATNEIQNFSKLEENTIEDKTVTKNTNANVTEKEMTIENSVNANVANNTILSNTITNNTTNSTKNNSENSVKNNISNNVDKNNSNSSNTNKDMNTSNTNNNVTKEEKKNNTVNNNITNKESLNVSNNSNSNLTNVQSANKKGRMWLDTIQDNPTYYVPMQKQISVVGWAISNDKNAKVRVYINNKLYISEMTRTQRPDVDKISGEYGGTATTQKAGYSNRIDISSLANGKYTLKVEQVSSENKVLSSVEKTFYIKRENARGRMWLDTIQDNPTYYVPMQKQISVVGWAISNDKNAKVRVYINNKLYISEMTRTQRPDVDKISGEYGGTNTTSKAGYSNRIDISSLSVGNYTLKVEQIDKDNNVISKVEAKFSIKEVEYKGNEWLDTVTEKEKIIVPTKETLRVRGWAISNDKNARVEISIDGVVQVKSAKRFSRSDVDKISGEYGGTATTPKAGYDTTLDIVNLPEGTHTVTVKQISSTGKTISIIERRFIIAKETAKGTMWLDTIQNNPTYYTPTQKTISVVGWAISNDKNAKVRVYINNKLYISEMTRTQRPDVDKISGEYGGTNTTSKAGYSNRIDISSLSVGNYTLKVEQIDKDNNVISKVEAKFSIKEVEYKGNEWLDTVTEKEKIIVPTKETLRVRGWAISNDKNARVEISIDGVVQVKSAKRFSRSDVDKISGEYGGTATTPKAGYDTTLDIVNLPEGTHTVTVKQISSTGKTISIIERRFIIEREKFNGYIDIDYPINLQLYTTSNKTLLVAGWTLSTDAKDTVEIKINGKKYSPNRWYRSDVNSADYGGKSKNPTPGYGYQIDLSKFSEGTYTVEVSVISRWGKVISSRSRKIEISFSKYAGVDVSRHNGKIDWQTLKNKGIEFAIIRIGYGQNSNQKDDYFEYNYSECKKYGIKVGVYLYSYAMNVEDSEKEALNCLKWLNNKKLDLPIYYDIENETDGYPQHTIDKGTLTEMALTFLKKISSSGYKAGLYSSKYWLESKFDMSRIENNYSVWVAQYTSLMQTSYKGKYDIWQWLDGKNDEMMGGLDRNWCYRKSLIH